MTAPSKVLITGAAGFVGSTLVERLLAEGREVVGVDSFDPFYPEEQKHRNLAAALDRKAFKLERADIRDAAAMAQVFHGGGFEGVVHLAALAGVRPSLQRPAEYADVNVRGTSVLLEQAVLHGKPRVVFASSSSVYGEREDGPFKETDPVERPVSPYAATKRAGELVAHAFHYGHGLQVVCARIFTAYGPRQRPDLAIRKFSERMLDGDEIPVYGDGTALRDFTFVDDLIDGLVRGLDRELGFAIVNVGAGRRIELRQLIRLLEKELGVDAKIDWQPRQVGDVSQTWADITAAREILGYVPRVSFEEGIARFVAWLREVR